VLIGQIEVALRRERTGEEYRRALGSALGGAVQLRQVVEALLFLGRAEGDAQLPELETLDLKGWASEHIASRLGLASGTARQIVLRTAEGPPHEVLAHPPLLGQLLDNLLDNACKHGHPGTPVIVEAFRAGSVAILAVEDAGPGIPAEDLPRVFEPFYRSAQARRLGTPGVGLGLAVVQRIATAFGAAVAVRSEPGSGCRVEVRFPIAEKTSGKQHPVAEESSSGAGRQSG
jgi:signal transduction histidine kinase